MIDLKEVVEAALAKKRAAEVKGRITYAVVFMDEEDNVLSSVRSRNLAKALAALSDTPDGATTVSICTVHAGLYEDIERYDIRDGRLVRRGS